MPGTDPDCHLAFINIESISDLLVSALARFEWLVRTRIVTSDPVVLHCRSLISSSSAFGNSGRAADLGAHRPADGYYNHSAGKSFGNNKDYGPSFGNSNRRGSNFGNNKDYGPSFGNSNRRGSNLREDGNCNGSGFTHRRPDARSSAIPDPGFSQWQPSERIRRLQNEQPGGRSWVRFPACPLPTDFRQQ